jgi:hypothetical protein
VHGEMEDKADDSAEDEEPAEEGQDERTFGHGEGSPDAGLILGPATTIENADRRVLKKSADTGCLAFPPGEEDGGKPGRWVLRGTMTGAPAPTRYAFF